MPLPVSIAHPAAHVHRSVPDPCRQAQEREGQATSPCPSSCQLASSASKLSPGRSPAIGSGAPVGKDCWSHEDTLQCEADHPLMHAEYAGAPQGQSQHQHRQQEAGWGAFGPLPEHHPQQELQPQRAHAPPDPPFQGGQEGWNSMSGLAGAELQAAAHHGFDQGRMDQAQHPLAMQPPHNQQVQQFHMLDSGVTLHQQQGGGDMATSAMPDADVETRKLVVLGLPWETEKETLHQYFAQFGPVQVGL